MNPNQPDGGPSTKVLTLKEAMMLKTQLEGDIKDLLNKFHQQTGLMPDSVQLRIVDASTLSYKHVMLARVEVEVEL